jgi:hypothetical protein
LKDSLKYCEDLKIQSKGADLLWKLRQPGGIQIILNWLSILIWRGLIRVPNGKLLWKKNSNFYHSYISNLMSLFHYRQLNMLLRFDFKSFQTLVNDWSKEHVIPHPFIAWDDDLKKSLAFGFRKKNDRKAAKTGITSWKAVDFLEFVIFSIWEFDFESKEQITKDKLLNEILLQKMNAYLFPGRYLISVDAGSASSVKNALFLHQQRRKVLMTTASNRGKHIWEYLKNEIPNKH